MTTKIKEITFTHIHDLANILGDENLISASLSAEGMPILLSLKQQPDYRIATSPDKPSFPKNKSDKENTFSVHWFENETWSTINLAPTFQNFHHVQPLQNGIWIAIRSRSNGINDHNAYIYSQSGEIMSTFYVGDGVEHAQTGDDGKIWISYFDEGIFGDQPYGHFGLVAFNQNGKLEFNYKNDWGGPVPAIDHCYALNVIDSNNVWCYYIDHTPFSLVHLVSGEIKRCFSELTIHGSHAIAANNNAVYLAGSYDARDHLYRLDLQDKTIETLRPANEDGKTIQKFRAIARSNTMYLIHQNQLFKAEF